VKPAGLVGVAPQRVERRADVVLPILAFLILLALFILVLRRAGRFVAATRDVERFRRAGFSHLDVDDLVQAKTLGLTPEEIRASERDDP